MIAAGSSRSEVAARFGISLSSVIHWTDPVADARHRAGVIAWCRRNPDRAAENTRAWRYSMAPEARARQNAAQRVRYASNPKYREQVFAGAERYRHSIQGAIASCLRICTLGHAQKGSRVHESLMNSMTGMNSDEFAESLRGPDTGQIDHIVPLCLFDLSQPEQLLRAVHPSNVQLLSREDNRAKGRLSMTADVMALPWVNTPDAIAAALAFISRRLGTLKRRDQNKTQ